MSCFLVPVSSFLNLATQTFSEPKSKLEIVVHYLWKYMTKPSVHTRKSNGCPEDATFEVALKCFSNKTGTKSTIKKIGPDVMQFLVGHRYSFFVILVGRWFCNRSNGLIPVI
ncbi:negative regulator of systemic acquired resistance SNI1-like isoform X2 [Arachis ipaensis]|uniref:negative regulator of systemic acquired resistance SNI1-like isoform X2 n=1 Tax=Arachis ipaensis TaxID=130454 RepID=UPI000A2B8527|nr:negative regulator of systemic acquired resistance SNI1-like isoform X2 [Arachis ipaensis]XP_020959484.1 negative regulator of systemic acquired resistance SNI1-like isoform X2 [Arachis ipaensis]XP_020959485.1 negative regulator of systemic acquired resistance SNI1-like isoform X2 [Arachis ipaensis]XP_029149777.1 negative regulator of systemic acquired resistance SNI1-like isoform X2 [Arachis hypogaea]